MKKIHLKTENEILKQQLKEMEEKIKSMSSSKPNKIKTRIDRRAIIRFRI